MPKADLERLALAVTVSLTLVSMCAAQQSSASNGPWSGWARCQINVSGQGYSDQQTHTWMITGGTPTVTGAFRVYPATWSVVGGGSLQHTQGSQTLVAQWATTAQKCERTPCGLRACLGREDVHPGETRANARSAFRQRLPAANRRRERADARNNRGRGVRVGISRC